MTIAVLFTLSFILTDISHLSKGDIDVDDDDIDDVDDDDADDMDDDGCDDNCDDNDVKDPVKGSILILSLLFALE